MYVVPAGGEADPAHHRAELAVQLLAEEVAAVEVVEAEAAVDEEAALAREIVRGHDGGWCHHIPVLGEWCSGVGTAW